MARPLSKDMSAARALYAPLLGHRRDFVRKMSAQALAPALRRLKPKAMRRHAKQLVAALAAGSVAAEAEKAEEGPGGARLRWDTLDGCGQLLFFAAKGVHGRTHSQVSTEGGGGVVACIGGCRQGIYLPSFGEEAMIGGSVVWFAINGCLVLRATSTAWCLLRNIAATITKQKIHAYSKACACIAMCRCWWMWKDANLAVSSLTRLYF